MGRVVSSVKQNRCKAIEAELPDGYRVAPWGLGGYAVRVDMSDGPIRRKYVGEMRSTHVGWSAASAVVEEWRTFQTSVEAALWLVEQWEANDR